MRMVDIIILLVVAAAVVLAVVTLVRKKKKGSCCCGCSGCNAAKSGGRKCPTDQKDL